MKKQKTDDDVANKNYIVQILASSIAQSLCLRGFEDDNNYTPELVDRVTNMINPVAPAPPPPRTMCQSRELVAITQVRDELRRMLQEYKKDTDEKLDQIAKDATDAHKSTTSTLTSIQQYIYTIVQRPFDFVATWSAAVNRIVRPAGLPHPPPPPLPPQNR